MSPIPNFDLAKLSQILRPQGVNPMDMNQPAPNLGMSNGQDDELNQALMGLLTPKDEQYDQFTRMLQMIPRRESFQPTTSRRIASALMGLGTASPGGYHGGTPVGFKSDIPGSLKVQDSVLNEPYNKALSDWGTRAEPTLEAAKLENTKNVNSRIAGSNIKSAQIREGTLQRQIDRDETVAANEKERIRQGDERLAIQSRNAAVQEYKAKNPNKVFKDANGFLVALDPVTGEGELVKDKDGNPIETGKLDDRTKLSIGLQNTLTAIDARTSASKELETDRQENRRELVRDRAATPPRPETAANKQTRLYNKALEGINKNPAWKDYISIDAVRKIFRVATPEEKKANMFGSGAVKGGDPEVAKEILKYIYGDEQPPQSITSKAAPAKVLETEARVLITDGAKKFTLPESQVDAYLKLHPEFKRGK